MSTARMGSRPRSLGWRTLRFIAQAELEPAAVRRAFHLSAIRRAVDKGKTSKAPLAVGRKVKPSQTTPPKQAFPKQASPKPPSPNPSPPPNSTQKESLSTLVTQRKLPLIGALLAGTFVCGYISYLTVIFLNSAPTPCSHDHPHPSRNGSRSFTEPLAPTGLPPTLNRATASEFDTGLDTPEWLMGITKLRQRLASSAAGHVLEVAVGTGRNLGFYDWETVVADEDALRELERQRRLRGRAGMQLGMTSFTGVDISGDVLEVARVKVRSAVPGAGAVVKKRARADWGTGDVDAAGRVQVLSVYDDKVRLIKSDAQRALPAPQVPSASWSSSQPGKYDTILQTFGLCSVTRPATLLANMASVLQPDTGRIFLLEHGRGTWGFVNNLLDRYAGRHFERFGCWWNRDIEGIVREAEEVVPGLEVVSIRRPGLLQAGTTLVVELKVRGEGKTV